MDVEVPYMPSVKNLHRILDAIQNAGAPDAFGLDFLKDLGFTSSNDRSVIKLLKYLGFLDGSGKPLGPYREFMDHTKAKKVLAARVRHAYQKDGYHVSLSRRVRGLLCIGRTGGSTVGGYVRTRRDRGCINDKRGPPAGCRLSGRARPHFPRGGQSSRHHQR